MAEKDILFIDIATIIKESDSALLKKLPRFVINILAKIVMQDELNEVLTKYKDDQGFDFLVKMIAELNLTLEIEGKENLPENERCFFAANHPFGIIDGLVLTHTVYSKYRHLQAIANDAFKFVPQLNPFITEVNVFGSSSKNHVKALNDLYESSTPITHFPAGEVSRKYQGKIQDSAWQKSFVAKSISSKRDIVPILFQGRNSRLFYFVFSLRRMLGIHLNLELILLPREMFKSKNKTIRVKIGEPISYQTFDKSKSHHQWAQVVREMVYKLGKN